MMKYEEIIDQLKKKIYKPIYFLSGEEPFYIDKITDYIAENVLTESEKAFNQSIFYGKDLKPEDVDNAARRYPMMANHQVIIVKEAQNLKNIENLVYYAEKPLKSTILVLCYKYKTLDKRKKIHKAVETNGVLFESKKLYENQVPDWITSYLKADNYKIDPVAALLLVEFLGTDLAKISNELDKLKILLPSSTTINTKHIEDNIGISKEYSNFELQNAIRQKDILKANRIILHFGQNQKDNPIVMTINSLFYFFSKVLVYHYLPSKEPRAAASAMGINPYFLKDYESAAKNYGKAKVVQIISMLREYDMKSKGWQNASTDPGELLKELVFKILH
jgi:DNA polymerase-3 subunit delta